MCINSSKLGINIDSFLLPLFFFFLYVDIITITGITNTEKIIMMKVTKPKLAKTGLSSKASIIIFYLKLKNIFRSIPSSFKVKKI